MADASDIAQQIVASETDATVAAAAAQTAVIAAEAAVTLAQEQTAIVASAAAAEINEATNDVARLNEEVSWLKSQLAQTQTTLETSNLATMATLAEIQASILALNSSGVSPSPTPPASEPELNPEVQVINPSADVVVQQEAEVSPAPQKPSLRLKRL